MCRFVPQVSIFVLYIDGCANYIASLYNSGVGALQDEAVEDAIASLFGGGNTVGSPSSSTSLYSSADKAAVVDGMPGYFG